MTEKEYYKNYREKNREKLNAYQREWRKRNKEKIKEYRRRYWGNKSKNLIMEGEKNNE
ncbi:hypothetical protein [Clostridium sp.]|uniref:hypothetical protein n=1 Tax=Clostridium sp. TaxID=1506 RepID=UPI0025B90D15|nr:hypothetical protein [Clostridium sp.]